MFFYVYLGRGRDDTLFLVLASHIAVRWLLRARVQRTALPSVHQPSPAFLANIGVGVGRAEKLIQSGRSILLSFTFVSRKRWKTPFRMKSSTSHEP